MMMRLIGKKRIMALAVLGLINAALAAALFLYVEPMREKAALRKQSVDREIRDLRSSIDNIKSKIKSLEENQDAYDALKARGFFVDQDRFLADKNFKSMMSWANLVGLSYNISALEEIQNPQADGIKYKLMQSKVEVQKIRAYTDSDIYNFIQQITKKFPGQTQLVSIVLRRGDELNQENLAKLAVNLRDPRAPSVAFVEADVAFNWRTMVPAGEEENASAGGGFQR